MAEGRTTGSDDGGLGTSARLLRLLSILQARPTWSAPELAERLEVTTRTVRRDITRLRELGYPVDAEAGPHGGYRLGRGANLPPLLFADDEAVAVAVGLRLAADGSVAGLDDATVSALTKLDQVLPAPLAARVRSVHETVVDLQGRSPDRVAGSLFFTLAQACRQGERVRLTYTPRDGEEHERRVDPYRLVRSGPRWYLACRVVDRDAWRTLRVDRIGEVHVTRQPVELVDPPDPADLVSRGMGVDPYAVQARLRLPLDAEAAQQVIPRTVGLHEPDGPGATIVTAGGPTVRQVARWIASLGCPIEVLGPPRAPRRRRRQRRGPPRRQPPLTASQTPNSSQLDDAPVDNCDKFGGGSTGGAARVRQPSGGRPRRRRAAARRGGVSPREPMVRRTTRQRASSRVVGSGRRSSVRATGGRQATAPDHSAFQTGLAAAGRMGGSSRNATPAAAYSATARLGLWCSRAALRPTQSRGGSTTPVPRPTRATSST
ncbi:YafY family transcriptional regulator [Aquihabitans sp. G128]|nr:YafY family transcriptional regulator [Aquihabitans sp. G128]